MHSDWMIIIANKALSRMLNRNIDEIICLNVYDFLPPFMVEECKKMCQKVIETKKSVKFEAGSSKMYVEHFINPVLDSKGNVSRLAVVTLNVTALKKTEGELAEAKNS